MAFELTNFRIDPRRIKSPDLFRALLGIPAMAYYQDLAAKAVAVHAAVEEGAANAFPGPFTSPATPRSVEIVFAAGWQGGDITITGTDQFGRAQTEVIADVAGTTVAGVKIWRTITAASKQTQAGTTDTATLQTGAKIGLVTPIKHAWGIGLVLGVAELFTWDTTYHAFTPTTAPNGTNDYTVLFPADWETARMLHTF